MTENVEVAEMTLFEHGNNCVCSDTICVVFAVIALAISIGISASFAYSLWFLKKWYSYSNNNLINLKMGNIKQINIKNRTYYYFNDINIKDSDSSLLKIDKKSYKNIGI